MLFQSPIQIAGTEERLDHDDSGNQQTIRARAQPDESTCGAVQC